jgi:hypothetical protein
LSSVIAKVCTNDQFRCDNNTKCIPITWQCDGDVDCDDHTDESINCTNINQDCTSTEFECLTSGECIPLSWKCDNERDCTDGSDEDEHCKYIYKYCIDTCIL